MICKNKIIVMKRSDIIYILFINILYAMFAYLTKPNTVYHIEVLFYPIYFCMLLFPSFIIFVKNHNLYVTNTYSLIRFKGQSKAYLFRIKYLLIESISFSLVFTVVVAILSIFFNGEIGFYAHMFVFINSFLVFFQIGIVSCIIDLRFPKTYISSIVLFVLVIFDYFLSLGFFSVFFSLFSYPIIQVLKQPDILRNIVSSSMMLTRCVVLIITGLIIFYKKQ